MWLLHNPDLCWRSMGFKKIFSHLALVAAVFASSSSKVFSQEDTWSCSDGSSDCSSLFGYIQKSEPIDSWPDLTVGNGKGTGGVLLKFTPKELVFGNLIVRAESVQMVRKFNLSNFSSTINGVPRKFRIAYQVYFATKDGIRGFVFDVLDYKTMNEVDLRLASWNPSLIAFSNDAWTP